eukprot:TRINITY_DN7126_c0_g1_i1.p1 TRINITY_DN7126_c0_g1~~TRINITY_DN7126_c0_g1_i1.p1  ORF type:complete len:392 (-),score=50.17 TRINITY_DN7126_c0_g1_i1:143-1252(-)
MDSTPNCLACAPAALDSETQKGLDGCSSCSSHVDPFLVEALQNPRHRLTVLRIELDIQRFMQSPDQHQFEFPHFPTSYLRLAAHRVAQHYGLQSMVSDNIVDGPGSRIIVKKTPESRYPAICLSEIPAKQPETDKSEQVKIAIRPRLHKSSMNGATEAGIKRSPVRTVEERKEEYERARARIFSTSNNSDLENVCSEATTDGRSFYSLSRDEIEGYKSTMDEPERTVSRDGISRVAIFRDREKDRSDPDYDRSYDRYYRGLMPNRNLNLGPFNLQSFPAPFIQYESSFPQLGQLPRTQTTASYGGPSNAILSPFCAVGSNQTSRDAVYMQWPTPAMMYAHSYEHFRHAHAMFQAPFCQQPLSFDYSQNH